MKHQAAGADCDLIDVGALPIALNELVFRRAGASDATIVGHFVDLNGRIVSPDGGTTWTYTGTISSTAVRLTTIFSLTSLPEVAVGFRGRITGQDVIYCAYWDALDAVPAALNTDMGNNAGRYTLIAADASALVIFGRA